ncbi:MAG: TatD family hydrolase [Polyangiaceae bacterium]
MSRGWVDSHTHLQDARIGDPDGVWNAAREAGIQTTLLAGVDHEDWKRQERLEHLPGVFFSAGLHPQRVAALAEAEVATELDALRAWFSARATRQRWVALGEIGMDGFGERRHTFALQQATFVAQLKLAQHLDLPVILHVLRAHEEALAVLREVGIPRAGGVVHSYSGSKELVPRYLDLGLDLAFGGAITWAPSNRAAEALRACPLDRLLLETDAPDQTPLAKRPKTNEPAFLVDVATVAAAIKGISLSELEVCTSENAERLFHFHETPVEGSS